MKPQRVIVVSHAHPDFSKGGGEIAAYRLYRELKKRPDTSALFIAVHASGRDNRSRDGSPFRNIGSGSDEILFDSSTDFLRLSNTHLPNVWRDFGALLQRYQPTVVHFHHYFRVGVEMIKEVKNFSPECKVVLTLHEYLAICPNNGQMIKTDGRLCYKANPLDCSTCMPQHTALDYFLRERYIKAFFELVDTFISPSRFLVERYVQWGVPREKILYLENGQDLPALKPAPRPLSNGELRGRFAYFGQITPFKGVDVLAEAVSNLTEKVRNKITVDIHGGGIEQLPNEFRARLEKKLNGAGDRLRLNGPYDPSELPRLMTQYDWIVVPSIWWENSPLVIQEAFKHGRPVICSAIGGMAEKVHDGISGLHCSRANPMDLASVMERATLTPGLWDSLYAKLPVPISAAQWADEQSRIYGKAVPSVGALA